MPQEGDVHVVPKDDKWGITVEGDPGASVSYDTQEEATAAGRAIAQRNRSELLVHGRDGQIRERNTYGEDPTSSKG